jgi:hypothetical protein
VIVLGVVLVLVGLPASCPAHHRHYRLDHATYRHRALGTGRSWAPSRRSLLLVLIQRSPTGSSSRGRPAGIVTAFDAQRLRGIRHRR